MWKRIDRQLLILIVIALAVSVLPYAIGGSWAPGGYEFYGNSALNPWDPGVYYGYIEQGRHGGVFMSDILTGENYRPTIFQPWWWLLGRLAEIFSVTTPVIYALARWLLVPVMVTAVWWAAKWLWPDRLAVWFASLIAILGSGLGGSLSLLSGNFDIVRYPDLWVAEAVPILNLWSSPHFLIVTAATVIALVSVERAWQEKTNRWLVWASAATATALILHPFHLITYLTFFILRTIWILIEKSPAWRRYLKTWLTVLFLCGPIILLYGLQVFYDPLTIDRASQNINQTWSWWKTLVLLGATVPAAAWTIRRYWTNPATRWLALWAAVAVVVIFFPLDFQRRLSHGLFIPWALLAAPAMATVWKGISASRWKPAVMVTIWLILFMPSSLATFSAMIQGYHYEVTTAPVRQSYLSPEWRQLVNEVKKQGNKTVLFGSITSSLVLSSLTGQRVYLAHNVETINFISKEREMIAYFKSWTDDQRQQWLKKRGICLFVFGPRERAYDQNYDPETQTWLENIWTGPTQALYRPTWCD